MIFSILREFVQKKNKKKNFESNKVINIKIDNIVINFRK